jgi:hypothetical protein
MHPKLREVAEPNGSTRGRQGCCYSPVSLEFEAGIRNGQESLVADIANQHGSLDSVNEGDKTEMNKASADHGVNSNRWPRDLDIPGPKMTASFIATHSERAAATSPFGSSKGR